MTFKTNLKRPYGGVCDGEEGNEGRINRPRLALTMNGQNNGLVPWARVERRRKMKREEEGEEDERGKEENEEREMREWK